MGERELLQNAKLWHRNYSNLKQRYWKDLLENICGPQSQKNNSNK